MRVKSFKKLIVNRTCKKLFSKPLNSYPKYFLLPFRLIQNNIWKFELHSVHFLYKLPAVLGKKLLSILVSYPIEDLRLIIYFPTIYKPNLYRGEFPYTDLFLLPVDFLPHITCKYMILLYFRI